MQRNQINLSDRALRQNKAFLKALYLNDDLDEVRKWFDKLDCDLLQRQPDEEMTLHSYLALMNSSFSIVLQIGSPFPTEIRYGTRGYDNQGVERFAFVECPCSEQNYKVVSSLFGKCYKKNL